MCPSNHRGCVVDRTLSERGQCVQPCCRANRRRAAGYLPSQVRLRRFTPVGFGRRGVDPDEVTEFLDQVANDLARAYTELARVREQNTRIKDALRRWQSRQVRSAQELAGR
ncbi:DivIVA domain-containing protein [Plantactinospora sp. WMMB782]|uniref:DivIVA domain-containing protein n=1 Tax=Plantactinospora sp. WMMB782 TaxID=3404121 RepID=UPI003B92F871